MIPTDLARVDAPSPLHREDPALVATFEARVAADEFIEPKDWMPDELSQNAGAPDLSARSQRDRWHASRRQLDRPGHRRCVAKPWLLAKV